MLNSVRRSPERRKTDVFGRSMFDCVIVGGGAIGLSIADQLSLRGRKVAVVDHRPTKRQTSWAAPGILPPASFDLAHDDFMRLCGLSWRLHAELADRFATDVGQKIGFRRCGGLHLARTAGEAASLAAVTRQWREDGVTVEQIQRGELARRFPALSAAVAAEEIRYACWAAGEAQVRTPRYLKALRTVCDRQGVHFIEQRRVTGIAAEGGQARSVETTDGPVVGTQVCVAAGAWSEELLRTVGWSIETKPWRGQVVLLEIQQPGFDFVVNEGPNYLVPRDDGLVLVGSSVEEVGFDDSNTPEVIQNLVDYASRLMPRLEKARQTHAWAGLRPGSPDGFPYLGRLPHLQNLFVAAGHYRSGIYLSPATGRVMSQLMCDEPPEVRLDSFRLDR